MKPRSGLILSLIFAQAFALNFSATAKLASSKESESEVSRPRWLLKPFLNLAEKDPAKLLRIAEKLFSADRLRMVSVEPRYAFEWQHRLAILSALTSFFDPESKKFTGLLRSQARNLIQKALHEDPSLLVRDGAVESIRRIVRMQPGETKVWQKSLEKAFFDSRNVIEGEGLFIRETILTTMREAALQPSKALRNGAAKDKNAKVQTLLKAWKTQAYDDLTFTR